jgi:dTDP-6-deoxy-L-talose 4-dehydrogenase (NAD+)
VTGATGFVGRHVVAALVARNHEVIAVSRDTAKAKSMAWWGAVRFVSCDVHSTELDISRALGTADILVHLAWPGLPNYRGLFHFEQNLPADYQFIKMMIDAGIKRVMVTGTCFEYGMQSGALSEDMCTQPSNPYGLAKDALRRFLGQLQEHVAFDLQWVRLFYMYGPGQNPGSLLAQLERSIENKESVFNMSGGEQLRDYLPIEEVAQRLTWLVERPACKGVINCCSGKPISVRKLVEDWIAARGDKIRPNLGHFPYPDYEPMAFWGDGTKLERWMRNG